MEHFQHPAVCSAWLKCLHPVFQALPSMGVPLNLCVGPTCALTLPSAYKLFVARSKPPVQGPSHRPTQAPPHSSFIPPIGMPTSAPQPLWQEAWGAYAFSALGCVPFPTHYIPSQGLRLPIWKGHVETPGEWRWRLRKVVWSPVQGVKSVCTCG